MKIHNVLSRQLKHYSLSDVTWPETLEQWQQFLVNINQTYFDFDQDRIMIDRSQQISSNEMRELYKNLEDAENIAHIGSWIFDIKNNRIQTSNEAEKILGIDRISTPIISYEDFLAIIHNDDHDFFKEKIHNAIHQNTSFDIETRIKTLNTYRWVNIQAKPAYNKKEQCVTILTGTLMDIDQRKSAEQRKDMEHAVLSALVVAESLENMLNKVLQIVCESFRWKLGVFWKWDDKKELLVRAGVWGENADILQSYLELVPNNTTSLESHFLIHQVWETKNPYLLDVTKENIEGYSELIKKLGIKSAFGFPIMAQEKPILVLEVLDFYSIDKEQFDSAIAASIKAVSYQLGLFIEKQETKKREILLNQELITSARLAGKAEVAVSVLHNVGNVLNSINVSVTLLEDKLVNSALLSGFIKINQQLKEHEKDFSQYVSNDPRGRQLPKYLTLFENTLTEERNSITQEIASLKNSVQHVKDVITTQQGLSSTSGTVECLSISAQIEAALSFVGFDEHYIIERHFEYDELLQLDKVKLMQILVNLVRNAKDALIESEQEKKLITATIKQAPGNMIQVVVIDNGIGIDPKNLILIFSFGFTTKKTGHGFGLQASALLAKEMGGSLKALSEGPGKGATFILTLPEKKADDYE